MTTRRRPPLPSLIIRAPFFIAFLALLYFLGRSLLARISGFAPALGLPAALPDITAGVLLALFAVIAVLVLTRFLSSND